MPKTEIEAALQGHERDVARLSAQLKEREARADDSEAVFMSAQILRHRIEMALLTSRLAISPRDSA